MSTVCITGASRGLGLALTKAFLQKTDYMVIAISRSREIVGLNSSLKAHPERLKCVCADITTTEGRNVIYKDVKEVGELSILMHNAGALLYKPFLEIGENELEQIYRVNVFAPFLLTQKLFPLFQNAHVINISSIGGVEGSLKFPGLSAYSSSKAALNCLTEMWTEEFKSTSHSFNCLALGSVQTEMFEHAFPGMDASSSPDEMANYILDFALDAPKVMRGKIIPLSKQNP